MFMSKYYVIIISPNEVFVDIMVLAAPPPVDPDDVYALTWRYSALKFDTGVKYLMLHT